MWECLQMVEVSQPMDGVLPLADYPSEAYMSTKTEIFISWDFQNTPLRLYEYDYVFFRSSELISLWCVYNFNRRRKLDVTPAQSAKKPCHVKMLFYKKNAEMYLNHLVCDQGSNAEGRNLMLILSFAPRDFSPCSPVFPSPRKPPISISNSSRNGGRGAIKWKFYY